MTVISAVYLCLAYYLQYRKSHEWGEADRFALTRIFDAITFSGSLMLLIGMVMPSVLAAIGSTRLFLLTAGLAGLVYGIHALRPR